MGLLERLSSWAGGGGTEVTVLVLGLDNSGKTTLLRALRPRPAGSSGAAADTHTKPTVGMERLPEHFHTLRLDRVTDKPWHLCAGSALAHAERGGGGAGGAGAGAGAGGALAEGIAWLARQLREQHAHKR